jgi:uncharacterized damage-inducible protein DinB
MEPTVHSTFLDMSRGRIVVHLTGQVAACLEALNDQMIWWRANEQSNAIGNLVLHCVGATRYYIGHVVGGRDFVRDRDSEFSERQEIPKADLLARLMFAANEADEVFRTFDAGRLMETTDKGRRPGTLMEVIAHQLVHYATHTGQIAFATKMLKADAIDDIWRKTRER